VTASAPAVGSDPQSARRQTVRRRDLIVSSDPGDLQLIAAAVDERLEIDQL
jgi:hypothetical protein